jgi:threonine dehydrogenase-like Zn-dependent dehydrogenase
MEGGFSLPVKYGYSLVGIVEEGPDAWQGRAVHLLHPHQQWCRVKASELSLVPEDVPLPRATLASNLETALNAVWDSGLSLGDSVLLVGYGIIGSLLARLVQGMQGVALQVYDRDVHRSRLAEKMGFRIVDQPGQQFDLAFHCSGSSEGLQRCIDHTGPESKIIELSWYGEQASSIRLGESFHYGRKQIISSQVSQIPADRRARWDYPRRKAAVMRFLKNPDFDRHITEIVDFEKSPALFGKIRKGDLSALSWVLKY